MKYEQRQAYRNIIELMPAGYGLCNFCKYAVWSGESYCEGALEDCDHPLSDRFNFPDPGEVWGGCDCWAFRPKETLQEMGIALGIMLEGNNPHYSNTHGGIIAIIPSANDRQEGIVGQYV